MYNYKKNIVEDCVAAIEEYIQENNLNVEDINQSQLEDLLFDVLIDYDNVTGNGSGSYTFNSKTAQDNLYGNEDLLENALREFGYEGLPFDHLTDYEWMDVIIRCSLLSYGIHKALNEIL